MGFLSTLIIGEVKGERGGFNSEVHLVIDHVVRESLNAQTTEVEHIIFISRYECQLLYRIINTCNNQILLVVGCMVVNIIRSLFDRH